MPVSTVTMLTMLTMLITRLLMLLPMVVIMLSPELVRMLTLMMLLITFTLTALPVPMLVVLMLVLMTPMTLTLRVVVVLMRESCLLLSDNACGLILLPTPIIEPHRMCCLRGRALSVLFTNPPKMDAFSNLNVVIAHSLALRFEYVNIITGRW